MKGSASSGSNITGMQRAETASKKRFDARVSPPSIAQNVELCKFINELLSLKDLRLVLPKVQPVNESQASLKIARKGAVLGSKLPEKYRRFSRFPILGISMSDSKNWMPKALFTS